MKYNLKLLKGDVLGGLTTAIISLPLAIAFGVASGVGAQAGLYAAIVIAFFAAVFGGTPAMVSGPTAPMVIAMAVIITTSADTLAEAFAIVMLTGLFQIGFGLCRLGRFIAYTPHSVVSGFMTGIGIIIISLQVEPILGLVDVKHIYSLDFSNLPLILTLEIREHVNWQAVGVAAVTAVVVFLWPRFLHRYIPVTLAALVLGSLVGVFVLTDVPVVGTVPTGLPDIQVPMIDFDFLIKVIEPALVLAIIGSIESLLVALISDALTRSRHNPDREIVGQGIANFFSGLFGGLPGSGSPIPTIVNIKAGGRTRVAALLSAVLLFLFLFDLGKLVEKIPLAVLAVLLFRIGWNVIDWRFISRLHKIERSHAIVMIATAFLTVFVDLLTAVAIGLIASGMINAMNAEQVELDSVISVPLIDIDSDNPFLPRIGLVKMQGRFTFASASKLQHVIAADISEHEVVIFDFSESEEFDDSAAMVIRQLVISSFEQGTPCVILGLSEKVARSLRSFRALDGIDDANYVETLDEAREVAKRFLN